MIFDELGKIRYIKLHFVLESVSDCSVPKYKASAIRGGIGEMLLRANCIRDRKCDQCDFESECIVQRTMYSKMDNHPGFMSERDSIGYCIECEDYRTEWKEGDPLPFNLILFGKTIVYFNQYVQALFALGQNGLGKDKARFRIKEILNSRKEPILSGNDVFMSHYVVQILGQYVEHRMREFDENGQGSIRFRSPLTVKHHREFIDTFDPEAVYASIKRRLYMLASFEKLEVLEFQDYMPLIPEWETVECRRIHVPRYSTRQDQKMVFSGLEGRVVYDRIAPEALWMLLAGELIHIGKNTSFGFGRYHVSSYDKNSRC